MRRSSKVKCGDKNKEIIEKEVKMPFIECTCGAKILVVPDVAAMNEAIKKHVAEHNDADEQFLAEQVLIAINKAIDKAIDKQNKTPPEKK